MSKKNLYILASILAVIILVLVAQGGQETPESAAMHSSPVDGISGNTVNEAVERAKADGSTAAVPTGQ